MSLGSARVADLLRHLVAVLFVVLPFGLQTQDEDG